MRKLTAIVAALGFLASTSLPTLAAPATQGVTTDTLSAAAHMKDKKDKKPAKKTDKKMDKKKGDKK